MSLFEHALNPHETPVSETQTSALLRLLPRPAARQSSVASRMRRIACATLRRASLQRVPASCLDIAHQIRASVPAPAMQTGVPR